MNYLGVVALMAMLGTAAGGSMVMASDGGYGAPWDMEAMGHHWGSDGCQCAEAGHGMMGEHPCENHHMADHDGDGIPNCQDEDWAPPEDGTGYRHQGCRT
jgi:hypothetical protein